MTGVMPFDEGMHGFKWQVVTGFTLCFWRKNVRLNTKDTKNTKKRKKKKETNVVARRALFPTKQSPRNDI